VFAHTSPFRPGPRFARSLTVPLRRPTCDTAAITQAAVLGLECLFEPGFDLAKAGVMLLELSDGSVLQGELDLEDESGRERSKLMGAVDLLNDRYGKGTLRIASTGTAGDQREWTMRQQRRTPQYTTDWRQVPIARA
jgi:DNA polymerase V